jgi:hypothetical protein
MERLDRTGEEVVNHIGQVCTIVSYRNNKDMEVEVTTLDGDMYLLHKQSYSRFSRGLIYVNPDCTVAEKVGRVQVKEESNEISNKEKYLAMAIGSFIALAFISLFFI